MFMLGVALFAAASAAAALAPTTDALIVARAIQGLGAAFVTPLSLTLLSDAVPEHRRGLAIGAWSGVAGLGVALGPVIGGAIVDGLSWHWIFWVNVPIALALIPLARRVLAESRGPNSALDPRGAACSPAPACSGSIYGIVRADALGWTSPVVLGAIAGGLVLLGLVPVLGGTRSGADAAAALLPQPHVLGDERRVVRDVLRRLRLDLLPLAVLPDRGGATRRSSRASGSCRGR